MTKQRAFLSLFLLIISVGVFAALFIGGISRQWQRSFSFVHAWSSALMAPERVKSAAQVERVIDGDTILLQNGEKVRYIGINAPESVDPRRKVECFGKEAAEFNKNLVEGKAVVLERDISDRDKYGRLLRFVYLEDGTLVNEVLVREGFASVSAYPPDIAKQDIFWEAEKQARSEKRGLWTEETCNGKK